MLQIENAKIFLRMPAELEQLAEEDFCCLLAVCYNSSFEKTLTASLVPGF